MKISENKVVSVHYTLKSVSGEQIESSRGHAPIQFIQGIGQMLPGFEEALNGKMVGESVDFSLPPEKAYGHQNPELVQKATKGQFPPETQIEAGMQFQADNGLVFRVLEVVGEDITLDGNHVLAGQTLNFDVEVLNIREATAEELDHKHVHGPGGHQH